MLTSKSDPIGVWLVSATHAPPDEERAVGLEPNQLAGLPAVNLEPTLKMEQQAYDLPGLLHTPRLRFSSKSRIVRS